MVEKGSQILLAAQESNWGQIQFKSELNDSTTYRYYWELVQAAKVSGQKLSDAAQKAFFS